MNGPAAPRVLFWSEYYWPYIGGPEVMATRLLPALRDRGFRFTVLTSQHELDLPSEDEVDGIPTAHGASSDGPPPVHPNGTIAIDHLVMVTPDLPRTVAAIEGRLGLPLKRSRDTDTYGAPMRQAFFRLGEVILEVIGRRRHERYRVRWLDDRESIHYPSDGTRIRPPRPSG